MTNSATIQLQQKALDKNISVDELLQFTYVVACKLEFSDIIDWCKKEIYGYGDDSISDYRIANGKIVARDDRGRQCPVELLGNQDLIPYLSLYEIKNPISVIQELKNSSDDFLFFSLPNKDIEKWIMTEIDNNTDKYYGHIKNINESIYQNFKPRYKLLFAIHKSVTDRIISSIRQRILDWSLYLEKEGILGENLIFTKEEKQMTANVTYNIGNVENMANHNSSSNIQQNSFIKKDDFQALSSALQSRGVGIDDINKLKLILDNQKDNQPTNELSPEVDSWIIKVLRKIEQQGYDIATNISIGALTALISQYLGI